MEEGKCEMDELGSPSLLNSSDCPSSVSMIDSARDISDKRSVGKLAKLSEDSERVLGEDSVDDR